MNATCNKVNNQHIPTIDEISEGVLLLNQFNGAIKIEDISRTLNGTFLIKFHNATIRINERTFSSKEESTLHALPAILQLSPKDDQYRELLSLEMMKELHTNNTEKIEFLETEKTYLQWTSYGSFATIAMILAVLITCFVRTRKQAEININTSREETTQRFDDPGERREIHPTIRLPEIFDLAQHYSINRPKFYEL